MKGLTTIEMPIYAKMLPPVRLECKGVSFIT